MKQSLRFLRAVVILSQMLFSVAVPLVVFILGAQWLQARFSLGKWVMAAGVLLGIIGAVAGLWNTVKALLQNDTKDEKTSVSYNDHD